MPDASAPASAIDWELLRAGVRLIALRAVGDPDAADEIAQESIARAVEVLGCPNKPANLGAYIAGIARHVIADHFRANARIVPVGPAYFDATTDDATDPLTAMCSEGELARVLDAVEQLSTDDRELVRLCYFEALTPTEIAARLGMPPERIRQRKLRALQRLRTAFDRGKPPRHDDASPPTIKSGIHRANGHGNAA